MKRVVAIVSGLIVTIGLVAGAAAQFAKPEEAIAYRKAAMTLVAAHFNAVGAVVRGDTPFAQEAVTQDAGMVETLMTVSREAFLVPGSDKGATGAKPDILKNPDGFNKVAAAAQAAAGQLAAAARAGDADGVKKAFGQMAQSCKACHGSYRK